MSFHVVFVSYRLLEESSEVHEKDFVFGKTEVSFTKRSSQKIPKKKVAAMCLFMCFLKRNYSLRLYSNLIQFSAVHFIFPSTCARGFNV